jgi:hypothetical protein
MTLPVRQDSCCKAGWPLVHAGWTAVAGPAIPAAGRVCRGPLFLLADNRAPPSCMLVIAVADLDATTAALKARGWQSDGDRFEVPNGPCLRFTDPSGNQYAILQNDRPDTMERAYADKSNGNAIRDKP